MCWPPKYKKLDNLTILSVLKYYGFFSAHFLLNRTLTGDGQQLYSIIRYSFVKHDRLIFLFSKKMQLYIYCTCTIQITLMYVKFQVQRHFYLKELHYTRLKKKNYFDLHFSSPTP